jgi:hypothetical protein
MPPKQSALFGLQTGASAPASRTLKQEAERLVGRKRPRASFTPGAKFSGNELVGGLTFRAEGQHEGLPTKIAEAYANGVKDNLGGAQKYASFQSSGALWDPHTRKAYDAGYKIGSGYFALTGADTARSLTTRAVLVSPPGVSQSGSPLKIAGFHPSAISQSVSESTSAHEKIFAAQANVLESRANGKLTNAGADLAIHAIFLASIAPGEYANEANFKGTSKSLVLSGRLLPDKPKSYEARREHLKLAINNLAQQLSSSDRTEIGRLVQSFLDSVAHTALPANVDARRLGKLFGSDTHAPLTTPRRRQPALGAGAPTLQMGKYLPAHELIPAPPAPIGSLAVKLARATFNFWDKGGE